MLPGSAGGRKCVLFVKRAQIVMSHQRREYDHALRFVLLGDFDVGKSALLQTLLPLKEPGTYGPTFRSTCVACRGKAVRLQLWDTEEQERFHAVPSNYFEKANAVLLVYDITNADSFSDIRNYWAKEVEEHAGIGIHVLLIGNKADLQAQRAVTTDQAEAFAQQNGMMFVEGSARTGENLGECLAQLADRVVRELEDSPGKAEQMSRMTLRSSAIARGPPRSTCF